MKTLNIKLQGGIALNPVVKVDGQVLKMQRDDKLSQSAVFQTEKDSVEIVVENALEIMGPCWWLVQMFFFFFSLFGIFNPRMEKFNYLICYKSTITLENEGNDITLRFQQIKDKAPAIKLDGAQSATEEVNECRVDEAAKKRRKQLKISRIIGSIVMLGVIALIVCLVAF